MSLVLKNTCVRWPILTLVVALGAVGCSAEAGSDEEVATSTAAINVGQFQGWNVIPNGTFTSGPAVDVPSNGDVNVYGRGGDNAIWANFFVSSVGGWLGWISLGGGFTSEPSAVRWATTSQAAGTEGFIAGKGGDDRIWVNPTLTSHPGGAHVLQGWRPVGSSTFASAPAVTFKTPYLYVVARKSDNVIYWTRNNVGSGFTDSGWSTWSAIPNGILNLNPAITTTSSGLVVVAARGGDNAFWYTTTTGTTWSSWQSVPNGTFTSGPAISAHGTNNVELSGRGGDNQIWITSLNPTTTASTGFSPIVNGTFSSGPASGAVDSSTGVVQVVGRGFDNAFYINKWQ